MHDVIKNYTEVINAIEHRLKDQNINQPKVIAVSKTFSLDKILPLIDYGHLDYGENKVQEACIDTVVPKAVLICRSTPK